LHNSFIIWLEPNCSKVLAPYLHTL
jgi:hypothetical protein